MKIRNAIITDNGLVIDPDDDVEIINHNNLYEFVYDEHNGYCNCKIIYPYHYD